MDLHTSHRILCWCVFRCMYIAVLHLKVIDYTGQFVVCILYSVLHH